MHFMEWIQFYQKKCNFHLYDSDSVIQLNNKNVKAENIVYPFKSDVFFTPAISTLNSTAPAMSALNYFWQFWHLPLLHSKRKQQIYIIFYLFFLTKAHA